MTEHELLSRDNFRKNVFSRDNHTCIAPVCSEDAVDAHHIVERGLWEDEGYYMANGASVCERHHRAAERNRIPPQYFWRELGVTDPPLPINVDMDTDKWGEEFDTPPHQNLRDYIKYPSTGHLPFSPEWDGSRVDFYNVDALLNVPIVITVKMDGSNACLRRDKPVARNGHHAQHESFDMLKSIHSEISWKIPEHLQIFGEWLYSEHSIHYVDDLALSSYFQPFGVYDTRYNLWLGWDKVQFWAQKLGFSTTEVLKSETYSNENEFYSDVNNIAKDVVDGGHEGIVVKSVYPMHYGQFSSQVGKYVREGHVQPNAKHWKNRDNRRNKVER